MQCLVFRCANGINVWVKQRTSRTTITWVNARDKFMVAADPPAASAEATLQALASHSIALAGAIEEVFELDI